MYKYGIVAIGYNRPDSMIRLLTALEAADYQGKRIMLIISIDNCGSDAVELVAKAAPWSHGEKVIRTFPVRQGLRNHVLKCGSTLEEYGLDAVAVFEDDVVPSLVFFPIWHNVPNDILTMRVSQAFRCTSMGPM